MLRESFLSLEMLINKEYKESKTSLNEYIHPLVPTRDTNFPAAKKDIQEDYIYLQKKTTNEKKTVIGTHIKFKSGLERNLNSNIFFIQSLSIFLLCNI